SPEANVELSHPGPIHEQTLNLCDYLIDRQSTAPAQRDRKIAWDETRLKAPKSSKASAARKGHAKREFRQRQFSDRGDDAIAGSDVASVIADFTDDAWLVACVWRPL